MCVSNTYRIFQSNGIFQIGSELAQLHLQPWAKRNSSPILTTETPFPNNQSRSTSLFMAPLLNQSRFRLPNTSTLTPSSTASHPVIAYQPHNSLAPASSNLIVVLLVPDHNTVVVRSFSFHFTIGKKAVTLLVRLPELVPIYSQANYSWQLLSKITKPHLHRIGGRILCVADAW